MHKLLNITGVAGYKTRRIWGNGLSVNTHKQNTYIRIQNTRLHTYIRTHTYIHIHTYIHTYIHTCIHTYIHNIYIYTHTNMHTCVHTYIHTYTQAHTT